MTPPRSAALATAAYRELLDGIKTRVRTARVREGWGAKVVVRLAADLHQEFPEMRGLSRANILYTRAFAEAYPEEAIVQQAVGQIPWGHNLALLAKIKDRDARLWYARQAVEHGAYKLTEALPGKLRDALPTIKQIETEFGVQPSKSKGQK